MPNRNISIKELKNIGDWYAEYYRDNKDMYSLTLDQIAIYENLASEREYT